MARFFVDVLMNCGDQICLPEGVVRHLHVLRLSEGECITLFNGRGGEYLATLQTIDRRVAHCIIEQFVAHSPESPLWIGLAQAISSGDRMDFTLQKGVEMGVNVFQPIAAQRSVVKLAGERAEKRIKRWQEIVISACEQSGRNTIPQVLPILTMEEWLRTATQADIRLLLSPLGRQSLGQVNGHLKSVWLMAGPEGGFNAIEETQARQAGWQLLRLGSRILRTETAALAAVSALQTVWGDYAC